MRFSSFPNWAPVFDQSCLCARDDLVERCLKVQKGERLFSASYLKLFRSKMGLSPQACGFLNSANGFRISALNYI